MAEPGVYLGFVLLMSLKRSLKYCGARTITGSDEEITRSGCCLVSMEALMKFIQLNYREGKTGTD